jgi:hypothetical protein
MTFNYENHKFSKYIIGSSLKYIFFLTFFIIFFLNIKQMVIFHHCENIVPDLVGMLIEWS